MPRSAAPTAPTRARAIAAMNRSARSSMSIGFALPVRIYGGKNATSVLAPARLKHGGQDRGDTDQHGAFDQRAADERGAAGANRQLNRVSTRAAQGARELEAGHVGAGNEQHRQRGADQHQQHPALIESPPGRLRRGGGVAEYPCARPRGLADSHAPLFHQRRGARHVGIPSARRAIEKTPPNPRPAGHEDRAPARSGSVSGRVAETCRHDSDDNQRLRGGRAASARRPAPASPNCSDRERLLAMSTGRGLV